jgi:outer membrane protein assembly factor BamA
MRPHLIFLFCVLLSVSASFAQFSFMPIVGYSPETSTQLGGLVLWNDLEVAAYATFRNQWKIKGNYYLSNFDEQLQTKLGLSYAKWPTRYYFSFPDDPDLYYENYTKREWQFEASTQSALFLPPALQGFRYGLDLDIEHTAVSRDSASVIVPPDTLPWRIGIGYNFSYDLRDNLNWPRQGIYAAWSQMFFTKLLGDYSFQSQNIDLRGYIPWPWFFPDAAIALAADLEWVSGAPPFDRLAGPDGVHHFRGVEEGIYQGRQSLTLQAEARTHLFWRFGGTIFGELNQTSPDWSAFGKEKWHYLYGIGGRMMLRESTKLNVRADLSYIDNEYWGIVVDLREAF